MKLVCAAHPTADAVARCVSCGRHLCQGCRRKRGARNFCQACEHAPARSHLPPRVKPVHQREAVPAVATAPVAGGSRRYRYASRVASRTASTRSPVLAALLSVVPGLGQAYSRSLLRGIGFFAAAMVAQEVGTPIVLGAFLYVFNLWDAYRCAQLHNDRLAVKPRDAKQTTKDRVDDAAFSITGLATLVYTFFQLGGLGRGPADILVPLAAVAACLLLAQETRS